MGAEEQIGGLEAEVALLQRSSRMALRNVILQAEDHRRP